VNGKLVYTRCITHRLPIIFAGILVLAACNTSIPQNPVAPDPVPEGWQRYEDKTYGFSLAYPAAYAPLASAPIFFRERRAGLTVVDNQVVYPRILSALSALNATGSLTDNRPELLIGVYDLAKYSFVDVPAGIEFTYDSTTDTWNGSEQSELPTRVTGTGWTGYRLGVGDAGGTLRIVAIPIPSYNIMLEIGFSYWIGENESGELIGDETEYRALIEAILATVRIKQQ